MVVPVVPKRRRVWGYTQSGAAQGALGHALCAEEW